MYLQQPRNQIPKPTTSLTLQDKWMGEIGNFTVPGTTNMSQISTPCLDSEWHEITDNQAIPNTGQH